MALFNRPGWKYIRGLAPPLLVLAVLLGWLGYLLYARAHWWQQTDENNVREWLNEARPFRETLPKLVRDYLDPNKPTPFTKAEEIREQLESLVEPTRVFPGQLPLFPEIYRIEVYFSDPSLAPIVWGSGTPRSGRGQVLEYDLLGEQDTRARLRIEYQLHAYNQRQREQERRQALLQGV